MAEAHPIQERPDLPVADRCRLLEIALAQLWDQVWWLSLSPEVRQGYEAQGFTSPILAFYTETDP